MNLIPESNRQRAAVGFSALAVLVLAVAQAMPARPADETVIGQTPRTAKPCEPLACMSAGPDRPRVGFGSTGSSAGERVGNRDTAARWANVEAPR